MSQPSDVPAYQPYGSPPPPSGGPLVCPKCRGQMRTYERNGVYLEQCDSCRGIFLDYGELEHLTTIEARLAPPPPAAQYDPGAVPPYGPAWGNKHGRRYRRGGLSGLFFSS
jgi:Zn-finger nucleic acid-binding protein